MLTFSCDANNDLYLDAKGNISTFTKDIEVIGQLVTNYLQTFLGEVFTDTSIGVDWFGVMLSDSNTLQDKIDEISAWILQVPKVTAINDIQYEQDKETRELKFNIDIQTIAGQLQINNFAVGI